MCHYEPGNTMTFVARMERGLDSVLTELREISRGIHPAILTTLAADSASSCRGARRQRSFGGPCTPTSSTNGSAPWKSPGLAVYSGNALLAAVAAIMRSEARLRG